MRIKSFEYALSIELSDEEVKEHPFVTKAGTADFYRFISQWFGEYEKLDIDCTAINVSENIQEQWFKYAEENDIADLGFMLLNYGPKASIKQKNMVTIMQGGIQ